MALMNCPECEKRISDKAISCPNCGCPINKQSNSPQEKYLCCPKCHSKELHAERKGFSGGKALAGVMLTGGIGLLAGTIGSDNVQITCLKCGNRFKAGEALSSSDLQPSSVVTRLPKGVNFHEREIVKFKYKCPLCNKIYDGDLHSCPKCGRYFHANDKTDEYKLDKGGGCFAVVLLFILLGSVLYTFI